MPFHSSIVRRLLAVGVALIAVLAFAPAANAGDRGGGKTYGATTLALDPGAAAALESLGVAAAPIEPATAGNDGLSFPIVNRLHNALRTGQIVHAGGIALSSDSTTVELRDFVINLDGEPDLTADVGGTRVSILDLDLSRAQVGFEGSALRAGPIDATLTADAAAALNDAFGVTAFAEGLKLGEATVRYRLHR